MERSARKTKYLQMASVLLTLFVLASVLCGCIGGNSNDVYLNVTQEQITVAVGETVTLIATVGNNETVQWASLDESIATVENGVITGVSEGETQVVVYCQNISTIFEVKVVRPNEPIIIPSDGESGSVLIMLDPITVEVGQSVLLSAMAPAGKTLVWYSINPSVATVENGIITGVAVGETTISVASGNASASCKVKVVQPSNAITKDGYRLVWNDEFDGETLDAEKWTYQYGTQDYFGESYGPAYWGNGELQYYTDSAENVGVRDGNLYITAKRQTMGDREYTSARILTRGRFARTYGYFEAKMKLPAQEGMWPAFWMLPEPASSANTRNEYGGWPVSGEIDIMEARGRLPFEVGTTLHYAENKSHKYAGDTTSLMFPISDWHIYAVEWTADSMTWYVDGRQVMKLLSSVWYNSSLQASASAPFDKPFHMLINLAVGGNYDGGRVPSDDFVEDTMLVDYVRVWEKL